MNRTHSWWYEEQQQQRKKKKICLRTLLIYDWVTGINSRCFPSDSTQDKADAFRFKRERTHTHTHIHLYAHSQLMSRACHCTDFACMKDINTAKYGQRQYAGKHSGKSRVVMGRRRWSNTKKTLRVNTNDTWNIILKFSLFELFKCASNRIQCICTHAQLLCNNWGANISTYLTKNANFLLIWTFCS